jgi:hypothetical protein
MNLKQGKYQVSLCRGSSCCPQLIVEGDKYTITDDFAPYSLGKLIDWKPLSSVGT